MLRAARQGKLTRLFNLLLGNCLPTRAREATGSAPKESFWSCYSRDPIIVLGGASFLTRSYVGVTPCMGVGYVRVHL